MKKTLLSVAALFVSCGSAFATSTVVAHYKMGELEVAGGAGVGGTAANALPSIGATNLPVAGTPTIQAGGPGSALGGSTHFMRFDGVEQRFEVAGNLLGANGTNDWMLEAWVRPQPDGTGLGMIVAHGHGGAGQVLNYNASNGKYGWFVGGVGSFEGSAVATGGAAWDHLALVRTGGLTTLYVNGVAAGSDAAQGTTPYIDGSAIGSQFSGGDDHGFTGDIDEVYFSTVVGFDPYADLHMSAPSEPNMGVAPGLAFGSVAAPGGSSFREVQIRNTGSTASLNVTLTLGGADPGYFTPLSDLSFSVGAGATESVFFTYNPAAPGSHSAILNIAHNDTSRPSPASVTLSGDAFPRYQVFGHFRMGEDEAAGGATIGSTPATLIDAAGDFDMTSTGTPALAGTGSAPATPTSTHHLSLAGGTDYYARGSNILAASNASTNWLIEAWVKPAELPAGGAFCVADGDGAGGAVIYQQGNHFGIGLGGNAFVLGQAPIVPGQWYHVALVKEPDFNNGRATLFVNGIMDHSVAFGGTATPARSSASIGAQSNGQAIWNGEVDDVYFTRVYHFNATTDLHAASIPADADGDQLGDAWEDQYFGDNDGFITWAELVQTNGSGDADGDGATDKAEHDAGTSPKDAEEVPPGPPVITSFTKNGNTVTVQFNGVMGRTYQLRRSTNLEDGFPAIRDTVTLNGTTSGTLIDHLAPAGRAFYRVQD